MKSYFAFTCKTPLQVLNVINFVMNNEMGSKDRSDIYIDNNFQKVYEIAERLKDIKVFQNVYVTDFALAKHRLSTLYGAAYIFFSKLALRRHTFPNPSFDRQYSCVFASSTTLDYFCVKRAFGIEKFIGFDDGLGSYSRNIYFDVHSSRMKAFDALFFRGKLLQSPVKIYLYRPDFYEGTVNCEICGLPKISDSMQETLKYVFQYRKNDLYRTHRTVYLTQPLKVKDRDTIEREQEVLRVLQKADGDLLVRIHPRQGAENYSDYSIDTINNMWELECLENVSEDNTLVSAGSTAQIFPKLLFDKEPKIIFLYELLVDQNKDPHYVTMRNAAEKIKRQYRDPEKVIIPRTMEEFKDALTCIDENGLDRFEL